MYNNVHFVHPASIVVTWQYLLSSLSVSTLVIMQLCASLSSISDYLVCLQVLLGKDQEFIYVDNY